MKLMEEWFSQFENYKTEWKEKTYLNKLVMGIAVLVMVLKPISDMIYTTRAFDMVLLGLAIVAVPIGMYTTKYTVQKIDVIPLIWLALCILSLFMSGEETVWLVWGKVMSIFPIYVLGKFISSKDEVMIVRLVRISLLIVLITNLIVLFSGNGYQTWAQGARTFSGTYYFKTDLALAMSQVILLYLNDNKLRIRNYIILTVAIVLAILSNSRIYFAIILLLILVCGVWAHNVGRKLNFTKLLITVGIGIVLSIFLLVVLARIPFFRERNFISFTTDGTLHDMLIYNLMYRNIIWKDVLEYFYQSGAVFIFWGKGFTFDIPWYDPHNLYLTVLYKFGILGIIALIMLISWAWRNIQKYAENNRYFLNIGVWIIVLLAGLSYTTGESTQYTWLLAFFTGCISRDYKRNKEL